MSKIIAVLGATGTQGGAVADKFLSLGWHVRGITRNISSEAAQALAAKGIELVSADVDDPPTLLLAFTGASVIFAVTDFWTPFFTSYAELSQVSDRATGEHASAIEIRRGKAIVDAAAETLGNEGKLERFIWSTLPSFKDLSKGKYTYTYHFDGKAEIAKYLKEQKGLWENSSLLNMGFYTTNVKQYKSMMASKDDANKYTFRNAGCNEVPFVVPSDAGIFVDLLVRAPPKQDLWGVSEMSSYQKYFEIWSEVTGIESRLEEVTVEYADKILPGGLGREVAESTAASEEFGWGDLVLPKHLNPDVQTTSLRKYIETEDWSEFRN